MEPQDDNLRSIKIAQYNHQVVLNMILKDSSSNESSHKISRNTNESFYGSAKIMVVDEESGLGMSQPSRPCLQYESTSSSLIDQEQPSSITKRNDPHQQYNLHQQKSNTSFAAESDAGDTIGSKSSTPGAYSMKGACIAGRSHVGMITPIDFSKENKKAAAYNNKIEKTFDSDAPDDTYHDDEQREKPGTLNLDEWIQSNVSSQQSQRHIVTTATSKCCNKKWILVSAIVVTVLATVALIFVLVSRINDGERKGYDGVNNDALIKHWTDLIEACNKNRFVEFDLLEDDPVLRYTHLKQQNMSVDFDNDLETCSPRHLALLSIALHDRSEMTNNSTNDGITTREFYALTVLFFSLGGTKWSNHSGWISNSDPCTWALVECNGEQNQVQKLMLNENNLVGTLPTELNLLTSILHLEMESNRINGYPSDEISRLSSLTHLGFAGTDLSGSLPSSLFSSLTHLESLTLPGSTKIDLSQELGSLSLLRTLKVYGSHLGGTIPTTLVLLNHISTLNIQNVGGTIPTGVVLLPDLQDLTVQAGILSGTIPNEMFQSPKTNWKRILLPHNFLTGTIPSEIGNQENLEVFDVQNNQLRGSIPSEIGRCSSILSAEFSVNKLSGTIPTEMAHLSLLKSLGLSKLGLTGTLPTEFGALNKRGNRTNTNDTFPLDTTATPLEMRMSACHGITGTIPANYCENSISVILTNKCSRDPLFQACEQLSCCEWVPLL